MQNKNRVVRWVPSLLMTLFGVIIFSATAMAADGDVTSMTLVDTDNDGYIDGVDVVVEYANAGGAGAACTGITDATDPATTIAQWSATDSGTTNAVTITSIGWVSGSAGVSCTFSLTLDDSDTDNSSFDTSATALDVVYDATGNELAITDGANPVNVAAIGSGVVEVDGAKPVAGQPILSTSANFNRVTIPYSEPMYIDVTNQDGTIDLGDFSSGSTTSTSAFGNIDAAGSIEQFGNFTTAGTVTQSSVTGNTLELTNGEKTIVITFNTADDTFFTNSTTAPSGTFTPDGTNYVLAQAPAATLATQSVNTAATIAAGGAGWDIVNTMDMSDNSFSDGPGGSGSIRYSWNAEAPSADFKTYRIFYSSSDSTPTVAEAVSVWGSASDVNMATSTNQTTIITGLTNGTVYYATLYAFDIAGNASIVSSTLSRTAGGSNTSQGSVIATPTALAATVDENNHVKLTWTDSSTAGVTGVRIYRGVSPLPVDGGSVYATVEQGVKTYTDTNLTAGQTVSYVIKAYAGANSSNAYETLTITVAAGSTAETPSAQTEDDEETDSEDSETTETDTTSSTKPQNYDEEKAKVVELKIVTIDIDRAANKCEAIVMLARAAKWEVDTTVLSDDFTDTPVWCKPYAREAKAKGVVQGRTATELGVAGEVSRYEVAVMLARVLGATDEALAEAAGKSLYDDEIVDWAKGAVNWLKAEGVMTGYPDGTFQGAKSILKVELAVAFARAFELY